MKSLKVVFPLALLVVLVLTNPPLEDHKAKVKTAYTELVDNEVDDVELGNGLSKLAKGLGGMVVNGVLDSRISRDNYILFSITKFKRKDRNDPIAIGIFGNVFLFGKPEFDKDQLNKELDLEF